MQQDAHFFVQYLITLGVLSCLLLDLCKFGALLYQFTIIYYMKIGVIRRSI